VDFLTSIFNFLTNINVTFYILAYLVGGIPFGLLLAKKFANIDVRQSGSQSIGATNVLRVLKEQDPSLAKKLAVATLVLDALKGMAVLFIANNIFVLTNATLWMIAVLSVLGHCYSPFLKFEGGKGVATGFGVMLFMLPFETLIAFVAWFIAGKILKISSLSSLIALLTLIIASYVIHPDLPSIKSHAPVFLITFIIVYKHIPNIVRLFKGNETKVV
jgi:acyl phosphate:glycerol-3-phosphate acyltransferase